MAGDQTISMNLTTDEGVRRADFTIDQANQIVAGLIGLMQQISARPRLDEDIEVAENPIKTDSFGIVPHPDSSTDGILVIRCGAAELQFSVPLAWLLQTLEGLKQLSEPNPDAPRPH